MSELLLRRRNLLIRKQEEGMNIRAVCFEADGEQTVSITKVGNAPIITMQYSYDGVNWDAWDLTPLPFGGSTKVYVRGVNNSRFGFDSSNYNQITFINKIISSPDDFVYVSGVVESLLNGENEVLMLNASGGLRNLFHDQTSLRSAENLRFEAISTGYNGTAVYAFMFTGCTNLLYAPKALSITKFSGGYECAAMFKNCESLVSAPELPATNLGGYCYRYMFQSCTNLKTIRCKAKVKAQSATELWLDAVATSGTFYGHSEYGWATGTSGIPSGWEFVELTD